MASNPSTLPQSYDIMIPVVAHHSPSDPPELLFTSHFLCRCPYIAVARIWTCGGRKLGNAWQSAGAAWELANTALSDRMRAMRPMDVLIGRIYVWQLDLWHHMYISLDTLEVCCHHTTTGEHILCAWRRVCSRANFANSAFEALLQIKPYLWPCGHHIGSSRRPAPKVKNEDNQLKGGELGFESQALAFSHGVLTGHQHRELGVRSPKA